MYTDNDILMLETAFLMAKQSKCVSHQVASIIVKDGRIVVTGVNGTPPNCVNCCDHANKMNWMTPIKDSPAAYFEFDGEHIIPPNDAHVAIISYSRGVVKYGKPVLSFYKNVNGVAHVWSDDPYYTNDFGYSIDPKVPKWFPTGSFFSDLMENINKIDGQKLVWKSKCISKKHSIIKVLNPLYREEHSSWSKQHEIHAELNAVLFAAKNGLSIDGATMYVTLSPCMDCSKALATSGIKRVVYCDLYDKNPTDWSKTLNESGIEIVRVDRSLLTNIVWDK